MPLPAPNLDDRRFQDLVNEARERIPQLCPEWTDHNVSDPGIAMIELFAWMTEVLIYRVNQVPDKNHLKFLDLVGIKLKPAVPAQVDITFILTAPQDSMISIPSGTEVHNIELNAGQGAKLVRSAGNSAQVLATEGEHTLIRLPSGEMRRIHKECKATIGSLGNQDHKNIKLGKAGKNRHRGKRPSVRGVAMAPNAHPHGGGEGKSPIGMPGPKTPWGKPALGAKTRKRKPSDKFIIRNRKRK